MDVLSAYTSGTTEPDMECTSEALDIGKIVSIVQADGQYSPRCSVFVNMVLFSLFVDLFVEKR